jgi:hypothetical protein
MLYELSSHNDGDTPEKEIEKLQAASQKFLDMAYEGLHDLNFAKMIIGLRTPDYDERLPRILKTLDETHQTNPHYLGWARHAYGDVLKTAR